MAILACSVTAMDGVPVPAPTTEAQIEGLVSSWGTRVGGGSGILDLDASTPAEMIALRGKLSWHPELVDSLYLVRHGVPFDVAFSLPVDERLPGLSLWPDLTAMNSTGLLGHGAGRVDDSLSNLAVFELRWSFKRRFGKLISVRSTLAACRTGFLVGPMPIRRRDRKRFRIPHAPVR